MIRLDDFNTRDLFALWYTYIEAFPRDERAPYKRLIMNYRKGNADFVAIRDDDETIGMIYTIIHKDLAYVFYFALKPQYRYQGKGTKVLELMRERYRDRRLFLAVERLDEPCDNLEDRIKRHDFYAKNGYIDLDYRLYERPLYYDVMSHGGVDIAPEEYHEMMVVWGGERVAERIGYFFVKKGEDYGNSI